MSRLRLWAAAAVTAVASVAADGPARSGPEPRDYHHQLAPHYTAGPVHHHTSHHRCSVRTNKEESEKSARQRDMFRPDRPCWR